MLKNSLILMYVVQIYKRKQHTKNQIDWIKNELTREVQSSCGQFKKNFYTFFKCVHNILVILKEKKFTKYSFSDL